MGECKQGYKDILGAAYDNICQMLCQYVCFCNHTQEQLVLFLALLQDHARWNLGSMKILD